MLSSPLATQSQVDAVLKVCSARFARLFAQSTLGLLVSSSVAAAFAILYGAVLLQKEAQYQTFAYDLGLFTQVAWNTLHGRPFATTLLGFNYLADHLAPSLAILAPLLLVWPDPRVLLVVQVSAVAGAGVGLYFAVLARTGDRPTALLVQLAYQLAPTSAWVALDEFHPISLALPAITFATALLWRRRYAWAAGCAALALLSTEDAVTWVIPFGLLIAAVCRGRQRLWGAALAGGATFWIIAYLFLLVPALRPAALLQSDPHPDIGVFVYCGRTWSSIVPCLAHSPGRLVALAMRPGGRATATAILGPTAGLGLLGPSFLVIAGRWFVQLLSVGPGDDTHHYVALLVPAAYLAAGEAASWLRRLGLPPRLPAAAVAVASLVAYVGGAPLPGGAAYAPPQAASKAHAATVDQAVALVPSGEQGAIVATSSIFPHLALRANVFLPWAAPTDPAYYVVDLTDAYPISQNQLRQLTVLWLARADYQLIFDRANVLVLRHTLVAPHVPASAGFGDAVTLRGFTFQRENKGLTAQFIWRTERPFGDRYHYFVHLVSNAGVAYSQQDGALVNGLSPLTPIPAGEPIRDSVAIAAPPSQLWYAYHLEVGWYDWRTGERLAMPGGASYLSLPLPT